MLMNSTITCSLSVKPFLIILRGRRDAQSSERRRRGAATTSPERRRRDAGAQTPRRAAAETLRRRIPSADAETPERESRVQTPRRREADFRVPDMMGCQETPGRRMAHPVSEVFLSMSNASLSATGSLTLFATSLALSLPFGGVIT